jgi:N utilization substance protein A
MVGAGIGTVERLGSMTPEELEAIPGIDEDIVGQIQASVVAFYGQYDEPAATEESETPAAGIASLESESGDPFENIETGVLEHDLATHQAALLEETEDGETLDLGRVEGLSGAPSTLREAEPRETGEAVASDTMGKID